MSPNEANRSRISGDPVAPYSTGSGDTFVELSWGQSAEAVGAIVAPGAERRKACRYGLNCYREAPAHRRECSHAGDRDYSGLLLQKGQSVELLALPTSASTPTGTCAVNQLGWFVAQRGKGSGGQGNVPACMMCCASHQHTKVSVCRGPCLAPQWKLEVTADGNGGRWEPIPTKVSLDPRHQMRLDHHAHQHQDSAFVLDGTACCKSPYFECRQDPHPRFNFRWTGVVRGLVPDCRYRFRVKHEGSSDWSTSSASVKTKSVFKDWAAAEVDMFSIVQNLEEVAQPRFMAESFVIELQSGVSNSSDKNIPVTTRYRPFSGSNRGHFTSEPGKTYLLYKIESTKLRTISFKHQNEETAERSEVEDGCAIGYKVLQSGGHCELTLESECADSVKVTVLRAEALEEISPERPSGRYLWIRKRGSPISLSHIEVCCNRDGKVVKIGLLPVDAAMSSSLSNSLASCMYFYPAGNCCDGSIRSFCNTGPGIGGGGYEWLRVDLERAYMNTHDLDDPEAMEVSRITIMNSGHSFQNRFLVGAELCLTDIGDPGQFQGGGLVEAITEIHENALVYTFEFGRNAVTVPSAATAATTAKAVKDSLGGLTPTYSILKTVNKNPCSPYIQSGHAAEVSRRMTETEEIIEASLKQWKVSDRGIERILQAIAAQPPQLSVRDLCTGKEQRLQEAGMDGADFVRIQIAMELQPGAVRSATQQLLGSVPLIPCFQRSSAIEDYPVSDFKYLQKVLADLERRNNHQWTKLDSGGRGVQLPFTADKTATSSESAAAISVITLPLLRVAWGPPLALLVQLTDGHLLQLTLPLPAPAPACRLTFLNCTFYAVRFLKKFSSAAEPYLIELRGPFSQQTPFLNPVFST